MKQSTTLTRQSTTKNLTLSAMFIALGLTLPFLTGQIPEIGMMLLPMHIPVLLCGLICGWKYGAIVGFILPLMRSAVFGMPMLMPMAVSMAFELATYGFVIGLLYGISKWQCIVALYRCMIIAMIAGRIVWGIAMWALLMGGFVPWGFTLELFISGAFVGAIPGIILQLILIPTVMVALNRAGLVRFHKARNDEEATI